MIYKNRFHAGEMLARELDDYRGDPDAIVVGLPRGGVQVAFAVARELALPLDVMQVRKLGVPGAEELAMGAITGSGVCVLKSEVIEPLGLPNEVIEAIAHRELREMERREMLYRGARPVAKLKDADVIVVDDGMATGATMLAAVRALRKEKPLSVVIAVPVAAPDCEADIGTEADAFIALQKPAHFHSVGKWYEDFAQVTDEEVMEMLIEMRHLQIGFEMRPRPEGEGPRGEARKG